jgi:uncharacterized protein YjbI with pentapeptide repeats
MSWLQYVAYGAFGSLAVELVEFHGAIRRTGRWPWLNDGEPGPLSFYVSVVIRTVLGAGMAWTLGGAQQISGAVGALAIGMAAPLILEQMAKQFPVQLESPEKGHRSQTETNQADGRRWLGSCRRRAAGSANDVDTSSIAELRSALARQTPAFRLRHRTGSSGLLASVLAAVRRPTPASVAQLDRNLNGANLRNAHLSGVDLGGAILSGADLTGADLSNANLGGAFLTGSDLCNAVLSGADLRDAHLSGADLRGAIAILSGTDLSNTDLTNAVLSGADLRGATLSGADLSGADLSGVELSMATLSGATLRGAILRMATLSRAVLSGACLGQADLRGAILTEADLSGAILTNATLSGADLGGAILSNATLSGADLSGAILSNADLRGTILGNADLRGTDLRGTDLRGAILGEARWNEETRWPTADFASEMRERSNETMLGVLVMHGGSGCSSSVHASPV